MILDKIKQLAVENGYELTEYAERIAKAKERFFGEEEWQRCPCDPNSDRACISARCKEDITRDGHCHCNCYQVKTEEQKMSKIPQRQEIWADDYSQAYVIGVTGFGFVRYIKKTGKVYRPLEFKKESFVKMYKFKCNSQIDVADLFKTENEE